MEAILRDFGEPAGVEVQVLYNRDVVSSARWSTRAAAVDAANEKLRELQRQGWATHW